MNLSNGTIGIAGLGLIGGSLAKDVRSLGLAKSIIGWNRTVCHAERALELGLIDRCEADLKSLVEHSDLIVLALPVNVLMKLLPEVLSWLRPGQYVIDVGSTKQAILAAVQSHPNRGQFVACHPMAGTEKSGPDAAIDHLFQNRFTLLIDADKSEAEALTCVKNLWTRVGAVLAEMSAEEHDRMAALLSHMPHVLAYSLARTIKEAERNDALNSQFAGGGLASMTRIAHSPITMWAPIFKQNKVFIIKAIEDFERHLKAFREAIETEDDERLQNLMK